MLLPRNTRASFPVVGERWQEAGLPYIQSYSAVEYGGGQQNWGIAQDHRGVMYIANNGGMLEYDGAFWRHNSIGGNLLGGSLAIDANGRIWVGAMRDLGYFSPDSTGNWQFTSLLERIPLQDREFEKFWRVAITAKGVYFHAQRVILRWAPHAKEVEFWRSDSGFGRAFVVEDEFYIREMRIGLMKMESDSLHCMPGGEMFSDIDIRAVLPWTNLDNGSQKRLYIQETSDPTQIENSNNTSQHLLVGTPKNGLFIYDGDSFQIFKTEADTFLKQNSIYCGAALNDGIYAIGTRHGGIAFISQNGSLRLILNKALGLPDNSIAHIYPDSQQGLWLALNKGIARIELSSPLSRHVSPKGLQSGVSSITRHKNRIYTSSAEGVYFMEQELSPWNSAVFKPVAGLQALCGQLLSAGKFLFVVSNKGIYQIENDRAKLFFHHKSLSPVCFARSKYDSNRIYIGFNNGVGLMRLRAGKWEFTGKIPGIHEFVEVIVEDGPDTLWFSTRYGSVIRSHVSAPGYSSWHDSTTIKIKRFKEEHGLSKGWTKIMSNDGELLFATDKGLRQFDQMSGTFKLSSALGKIFADTTWNFGDAIFETDELGRVWAARSHNGTTEFGFATPAIDGNYMWDSTPFWRFKNFGGIWNFYIDQKYNGVFWFGGASGIIRYDEAIEKDYKAIYPALIRRVTINEDSVIYGGNLPKPEITNFTSILDFKDNSIQIEFAAPYFDNESANQFQYFMEGFEDGWSNWTSETKVNYRKLAEGQYRFHVRARNIYQRAGEESAFAFTIQPPWYRTWWSFGLYSGIILAILYGIRSYELNRRKLKHQIEIERLQAETERVKAGKLEELDKLKSDFFANISHEFRTPLTLILGPAEKMIEKQSGENKSNLNLIHRNAHRLLQLINQLLDLSKLEQGEMRLQASPSDIIPFLKGLVLSFESLAQQKGIDLQFEVADTSQDLKTDAPSHVKADTYFDPDKIEKIIMNILSNAFKFTKTGGEVRVTLLLLTECKLKSDRNIKDQSYEIIHPGCQVCSNGAGNERSGICAQINITDSGVGIPSDQLPHVFDRFYQVDNSSRRAHGGTGIGLALVKELVELHFGSITVSSEEGRGTTFTICLPLSKAHLQPEHIIETATSFQPTASLIPEEGTGEPETSDKIFVDEQESADVPLILIIEDNDDVRAYIRAQLKHEYAILEAADGECGIARAIEVIPDLVISDVMMPKKDGYEVCHTLKTDERTSHIPVILLTAKARDQEKLAGLETGADAYLLKPFQQQELTIRVRMLIELRRNLRQRFSTATIIKPSEIEASSMDRIFLERAIEIIETHFTDEAFSVEVLAMQAAMSVSQMNRKLNALIGQPAGQMIRSMRLQRAADLLIKKSGTVAEVCYAVGFSDQANFTRSFKKQFDCSPSEYQKSQNA